MYANNTAYGCLCTYGGRKTISRQLNIRNIEWKQSKSAWYNNSYLISCKPAFKAPMSLFVALLSMSCNVQHQSRRGALDVHEWDGSFLGQSAFFHMTSVIGHVYSLDFPGQYNSWDKTDPLDLFDAKTVRVESNPKVSSLITLSLTWFKLKPIAAFLLLQFLTF
jgi:hypothetical protein